jgi:MarR family transcriptional regulator for hemolysin
MIGPLSEAGMDGRDLTFNYLVADVSRLTTAAFTARVRDLGLSRAQWVLMAALYRSDDVNQGQLAELLGVAPISVGRMVDRMERDGWVKRAPVPGDRRAYRVQLTPKARRLRPRLRRLADDTEREALHGLGAGERRLMLAALLKVRTALLAAHGRGGVRR